MAETLPHKANCIVQRDKIVAYILNDKHVVGQSKARFFSGFGFSKDRHDLLAAALVEHGQTRPVIGKVDDGYGPRYTVQCEINTPLGRRPCIETVWILEPGSTNPRFITAYPSG